MERKRGKPDEKREIVSVKNGRGPRVKDADEDRRGKKIEDSGKPLPKRVLRSASKLSMTVLPDVEAKKIPFGKELILHEDLQPKIGEDFSSPENSTMEESMQGRKNPMLLSPIIRCIFGFLDFENVKNCRLISREWSSVGKLALTSRALIHFKKGTPDRFPSDFYSCFLDSAARFSSFEISRSRGRPWAVEEFSQFFLEQQKSIKELTFTIRDLIQDNNMVSENFDISPWISKSPMVKNDAKLVTKLSINGPFAIPVHLLKHVKDLSLSFCRINLEAGIQICPVKLSLYGIEFYQDENSLSSIQINDVVKLSSAKEVDLDSGSRYSKKTDMEIDFTGNCRLESLTLQNIKIANWETSNWDIQQLYMSYMDAPTVTQMTIRELYLSLIDTGSFDLFSLPRSIEKLGIGERAKVRCGQPTTLENLKYFSVEVNTGTDFSFLSHFSNCPQLAHLKLCFENDGTIKEIKLCMIPKTVKTITLDNCLIDWVHGSRNYGNIEKIVFIDVEINFRKICKAKISVDDIIIICGKSNAHASFQNVANIFKYQKRFIFCKRFYIGELNWDEMELEDSVLDERVDAKSAFYVFENGEQGRALDKKSFYQFTDMPEHIILKYD